jgi:hypothetical protein
MVRVRRPVVLGLAALLVGACADMRSGAVGAGRSAADWSLAREVTIVMTEYRFTPGELSF